MKEIQYKNHDERFGDEFVFTIPEMVKTYRDLGWDEYEDYPSEEIKTMTDDEIIDDIFKHDIEKI